MRYDPFAVDEDINPPARLPARVPPPSLDSGLVFAGVVARAVSSLLEIIPYRQRSVRMILSVYCRVCSRCSTFDTPRPHDLYDMGWRAVRRRDGGAFSARCPGCTAARKATTVDVETLLQAAAEVEADPSKRAEVYARLTPAEQDLWLASGGLDLGSTLPMRIVNCIREEAAKARAEVSKWDRLVVQLERRY